MSARVKKTLADWARRGFFGDGTRIIGKKNKNNNNIFVCAARRVTGGRGVLVTYRNAVADSRRHEDGRYTYPTFVCNHLHIL